jgi:predicted TIM-barrel fold metal-dependent hydrolase
MRLNRRELLSTSVAVGMVAGVSSASISPYARTDEDVSHRPRIIDTNVSLFHWPFRRLPLDDADSLVAKLRSLGIEQAWAGSFEGLLHRDITSVNRRLADACRERPELLPIGSINLELPDWEADLHRCFGELEMPGVRLHPNYHGYKLDDPRFVRLIELATKAGRFVQLVTVLEDTRTQHPLVRVADVDLTPLPKFMSQVEGARIQLLNHRPSTATLKIFAKIDGLYFDTSRVESTDGVPQLVDQLPPGRVLYGSHAPLLIPEAALIRVNEAGLLDEVTLRGLLGENAEGLMKANRS